VRRFVLFATSLAALASIGLLASSARAADPIDTVSLTNAERQAHGLAPLSVATDLQSEAQRHADDMAAASALWHTPDLASRVTGWKRLGENVGRGPNAQAIHAGFMASPTHRANILQPAYTQMGVGMATTSDGRLYISVLYRLPLHARAAGRVSTAAATRAAPVPANVKVPVQVAGATVTRPEPAADALPGKQLASAHLPQPGIRPANGRHTLVGLALVLLVATLAGHGRHLAAARARARRRR
jgi:hypothetical protein